MESLELIKYFKLSLFCQIDTFSHFVVFNEWRIIVTFLGLGFPGLTCTLDLAWAVLALVAAIELGLD